MPGPKYNYFNVLEDLRVGDTQRKGMLSIYDSDLNISSSADGTLNINADSTVKVKATTTELEATTITLDGDVTVDGSHTLNAGSGTFTAGGDVTVTSGDLTRRYVKYISGTSASQIPTNFTRATEWTEIIDDGTALISGKSGNIRVKLPKTPSIGKSVTVVYIHSGAQIVGGCTGKLSGSSIYVGTNTAEHEWYYFTFRHKGQGVTLVNDGASYYLAHPSGAYDGPTMSVT